MTDTNDFIAKRLGTDHRPLAYGEVAEYGRRRKTAVKVINFFLAVSAGGVIALIAFYVQSH